jgi:hypothetical protein
MLRPTKMLLFVSLFMAGLAGWWVQGEAVGAPRKAEACVDELSRTKQELTRALEDARHAKEEATVAQRELAELRHREEVRHRGVQEQLGGHPMVDNLK